MTTRPCRADAAPNDDVMAGAATPSRSIQLTEWFLYALLFDAEVFASLAKHHGALVTFDGASPRRTSKVKAPS